METCNAICKYGFMCISETYFDSLVEAEDDDLRISGYKLIRPDHPSNTKSGGLCTYYQGSLLLLAKSKLVTLKDRSTDPQVKKIQNSIIFFLNLNSYLSILKPLNLTSQFYMVIKMHNQSLGGTLILTYEVMQLNNLTSSRG